MGLASLSHQSTAASLECASLGPRKNGRRLPRALITSIFITCHSGDWAVGRSGRRRETRGHKRRQTARKQRFSYFFVIKASIFSSIFWPHVWILLTWDVYFDVIGATLECVTPSRRPSSPINNGVWKAHFKRTAEMSFLLETQRLMRFLEIFKTWILIVILKDLDWLILKIGSVRSRIYATEHRKNGLHFFRC